jgi:hypothetical protein
MKHVFNITKLEKRIQLHTLNYEQHIFTIKHAFKMSLYRKKMI